MPDLDDFASGRLAALEQQTLRRTLTPTARGTNLWVTRNGRRLLSFSCNDYLGLSQHPRLKQAAIAAIERYGVGAGASRLVTGDHPLYAELESRLARFKHTAAASVFGSGYLINSGIAQALVGDGDLILIDDLAHSSLWTGARLSRANVTPFRHNDTAHLAELSQQHRSGARHALIVTESVFSMDGDRAPLAALTALSKQHDAWLMIDEAHDLTPHDPKAPVVPLRVGTLSKAFGGYGGYLAASAPVIDLMKSRARTLIYSTGLPPSVIASAIAALDVVEADPDLMAQPLRKARTFTAAAGLPEAESAIVPIRIGEAADALAASRRLEAEGFLAVAIRPPTVPDGTARLRLAFAAGHPDTEILRLAAIVKAHILKAPSA